MRWYLFVGEGLRLNLFLLSRIKYTPVMGGVSSLLARCCFMGALSRGKSETSLCFEIVDLFRMICWKNLKVKRAYNAHQEGYEYKPLNSTAMAVEEETYSNVDVSVDTTMQATGSSAANTKKTYDEMRDERRSLW